MKHFHTIAKQMLSHLLILGLMIPNVVSAATWTPSTLSAKTVGDTLTTNDFNTLMNVLKTFSLNDGVDTTPGNTDDTLTIGSGDTGTVSWNGDTIAINKGGTGATTATGAASNLGLGTEDTVDFTALSLAAGTAMTAILDEDAMGTDSATALATQQSIKAYVDSQTGSVTTLTDTDADTLVQVEESGDEDFIRFDTAGTERLTIDNEGAFGITANTTLDGTPSTTGGHISVAAATFNDSATAGSGTATNATFTAIAAPTLSATNASVTTTNAATAYIAGAPTAGTNQTITNPYALWVDGGDIRLDGSINDSSNASTIDPNTRFLNDSNGQDRVDWENGTLSGSSDDITVDWENLQLTYGASGDPVLSWNASGVQLAISGTLGAARVNEFSIDGTMAGNSDVAVPTEAAVVTYVASQLGATTSISDTDNDTQIQVEESGDEDFIRFDTAGTERLTIDNEGAFGITANTTLDGTPGTTGGHISIAAATFNDSATAGSGTATAATFTAIAAPTLSATNASVTTTDAATLYVAAAPTAGTNQTITNPYALWIDGGTSRLDGDLDLDLTKDVKDLTLEVETSKGTCTTTNVGQVTYEEIADIGTFQGCTRTGTSSYAWIQLQIFSQ